MWDDPRRLNLLAIALSGVAALMLVAGGLAWVVRQSWFEIREVVVTTPLQRASGAQVEAVIRDLKGTFFTLDLNAAQGTLRAVPWVRSVALRRQWPRRLAIDIEEHVPLARWNDNALVNTRGEVFTATYPGDLPRFEGPDGRAAQMLQHYAAWVALLAPLSLDIGTLRLSSRGGWEIAATGKRGPLAIELGRDDADARIARFVGVYGRTIGALERAGASVAQVDLRYRNGFAVRASGLPATAARKT
jgi:cell division protein FtsQ